MSIKRRLVHGLPILALVVFALSGRAHGAAVAEPLIQLSSIGCGTGASSFNIEPYMAANPRTAGTPHATLIGVWTQWRGLYRDVAVSSSDNGHTWRQTTLPFSGCGPQTPAGDWSGDPWISIGPDGTAYAAGMRLTQVLASTSQDQGRTWRRLRTVATPSAASFQVDKETVTADPSRPGVAYMTWDQRSEQQSPTNPDSGSTWFTKTIDGGKTWARPREIIPARRYVTTGSAQIVVDGHTGSLYLIYGSFVGRHTPRAAGSSGQDAGGVQGERSARQAIRIHIVIRVLTSSDGGGRWSRPRTIGTVATSTNTTPNSPYYDDPCATSPCFRTGSWVPEVAIDPSKGTIYVVWMQLRPGGARIMMTASHDGARTWSPARQISTPPDLPAFTPSIAVNARGVIGVTYYTHEAGNGPEVLTDYWFRDSHDGGSHFGPAVHLAGPFDHSRAINGGGAYFLGDYMGLTAEGNQFRAIFVMVDQSSGTAHQDVFTARIAP